MNWLDMFTEIDTLKKLTLGVAVAAALVFAAFGGYYYWDRYVRLGDMSPIERDIAALEEAVREDPQDPQRRIALAEYYLGKGLYAQAAEQAELVLQAYPEEERALLVAGIAYARQEAFQQAIEPLAAFVDLRKDSPMANSDMALETAYYFLGDSYLALGQPQEAVAALEAAVAIERTDADALYKLGEAWLQLDDTAQALFYLERAVRLVPDFTEAYTAMLTVYEQSGQDAHTDFARGMQFYSVGDYEAAQTYLLQATQALPEFAPAFVGLAMTYERLGDLEAALQAAEQALTLAPDDFSARQTYGRIQAALTP